VPSDERLKAGPTPLGADYFDELLERIRDIRAQAAVRARLAQKARRIFAVQ
jgi:hypothetical protein